MKHAHNYSLSSQVFFHIIQFMMMNKFLNQFMQVSQFSALIFL